MAAWFRMVMDPIPGTTAPPEGTQRLASAPHSPKAVAAVIGLRAARTTKMFTMWLAKFGKLLAPALDGWDPGG